MPKEGSTSVAISAIIALGVIFVQEKKQSNMEEKTDVEITSEGNVAAVVFKADSISNVAGIAVVCEKLRMFIEENRPRGIVFDFEQVKFFSSQVLGLLLDVRARLKTYNGEVVVSAIEPRLYRVFKITNLDKIFRFFPDRQSAVKAIGSADAGQGCS
jgi:anti-sigma B factor antagonist